MTPNLDAIEAACRKATPGPWVHSPCKDHPQGHESLPCWKVRDSTGVVVGSHEDREYIATMSPDVALALVAEVRLLRAVAEAARKTSIAVKAMAEDHTMKLVECVEIDAALAALHPPCASEKT